MEEPKLSIKVEDLTEQEKELLAPLIETPLYQRAIKPVLARMGNGYSRSAAEIAPDFNSVLLIRGRLQMLKELNRLLVAVNRDSKKDKSGNVKSK